MSPSKLCLLRWLRRSSILDSLLSAYRKSPNFCFQDVKSETCRIYPKFKLCLLDAYVFSISLVKTLNFSDPFVNEQTAFQIQIPSFPEHVVSSPEYINSQHRSFT